MRFRPLIAVAFLLGLFGLLAACTQAPPVAEEKKPRRKSFEAGNLSSAPVAESADATEAKAQQINETWDRAKEATSEAEQQRLINEALRETRALADEPSPGSTPP